jgi:transposase
MTQVTAETNVRTIGLDLGDTTSTLCEVDAGGKILSRETISTSRSALTARFKPVSPVRIVLEACGQSNWITKLLRSFGHEVHVANPRQLKVISASVKKTDRNDAHLLARIGRADLGLLRPTHVRGQVSIEVRTVLNARRNLVQIRTRLINSVRASAKGFGQKLATCGSDKFVDMAKISLAAGLKALIQPQLDTLAFLQQQIERYDDEIDRLGRECYPQTALLRTIHGVGPQVALAFVAAIDDPSRFKRSRDVGAYLGLTPRRDQSGDSDPRLRITKEGDGDMRSLLVSAATHVMRKRAPDCDLKRFGQRLEGPTPTPRDRARARIAVARKLAVVMHRLLRNGEVYDGQYHAALARDEEAAS